jgi:anti-repressor protein
VKDGEIYWVLKDVCESLGINNSKMVASRLDENEKAGVSLTDLSSNGTRQKRAFTMINEPGLYKVILRSDKPEAKNFMNWVTHEVLPAIRRHGAYISSGKLEELMQSPDTWVKLIRTLQQERREKTMLKAKIKKDKAKVTFATAVEASKDGILIRELAKILKGNGVNVGQNRLFTKLRKDGFLIRQEGSDYNSPTQKAMELGLFKIKETAFTEPDGKVTLRRTAKVTGKGQSYFVNYFLAKPKANPKKKVAKKPIKTNKAKKVTKLTQIKSKQKSQKKETKNV